MHNRQSDGKTFMPHITADLGIPYLPSLDTEEGVYSERKV